MKNKKFYFLSAEARLKTGFRKKMWPQLLTAWFTLFLGAQFVTAQRAEQDTLRRDTLKVGKIDEVVVTGYKSRKRADINQAQVEISSKELSEQPNSLSLSNMLQGKAAGVFVQTQNGQPGSSGYISIRGINSFDQADPTIVIDGQYVTLREFNALNPQEVESITVLKDAASAAQYGSKASNGVIVVTTKNGSSKKTEYVFNTRMGFSQKIPDRVFNFQMMNARQKLDFENSIATLVGGKTYTAEEIARLSALDHDWQKDILQNSFEESYLFSASGGSEKNTFYYSMGYDHNSGIVKYLDAFKRYSAKGKFDTQLNSNLKVGLTSSFSYQTSRDVVNQNSTYNPFFYMYGVNPYEPLYNPDGTLNETRFGNPIYEHLQNNRGNSDQTVFTGNIYGEYRLWEGLKFKSTFNNTYSIGEFDDVIKKGTYLDLEYEYDGRLSSIKNTSYYYTLNNRLDFNKSFGNHHLDATVFHEFSAIKGKNLILEKREIQNIYLDPFLLSNYKTSITDMGGRSKTVNTSLAALLDYNFASRYYLSASARRDGSSKFGANYKFGNFWSVSAGWNLAKEKFFNIPGLDLLKFRASYGVLGNDSSLSGYSDVDYLYIKKYAQYTTAIPSAGNPDLRWEKAQMQNYGLNFSYKNRLSGSFEIFKAKRTDFIQYVSGSTVTGEYSYPINAGDIENKGVEAELSYDIISNKRLNLVWNLHGNISAIKNKVLFLQNYENERVRYYYNILKVGETPDLFYLVKNAGVNPLNGEAMYYDIDGNETNRYRSSNRQILYGKSPYPKVFGGFGTTVSFGKMDLSAAFAYKFGGWTLNTAERIRLNAVAYSNNKSTDALNFWKNPGDTDVLPKPNPYGILLTDYFLQKTDNVTFRSLNLGYTFDRAFWGDKVPIKSLRVYFQGENLYIWTKFKGDPNIGRTNDDISINGITNNTYAYNYPSQRTFSLGFHINF